MTWFKNRLRQEWPYVLSAQRGYWTLKVAPSAFTWLQFREQTSCSYLLSFCNLISCSMNDFAFTFVPTPSTRTLLLLFLLIILIYRHHHPILSRVKSNACLFCIHVLRHRKLAVLECNCSRSGVDLGQLEYLHSSLNHVNKNQNSLPRALRKSHFASFQFRSAVQPGVAEHFVTGCISIVPFLFQSTVTGMSRRNIISKLELQAENDLREGHFLCIVCTCV